MLKDNLPAGQHWQKLFDFLAKSGQHELDLHQKDGQRFLRELSNAYEIFTSPHSISPQQFDPIPLIFDQQEWKKIEAGLIQRARLFNLILEDLYGKQEILRQKLLPSEIIFQHGGFLYPAMYLRPANFRRLDFFSSTLQKRNDGNYWIIEDHSQPIFGAGYALANRIVMRNSNPNLFRNFQVHMLAIYFRNLREALISLHQGDKDDPLIVLLSPGPGYQSYFEHAYLASYLGFPLVQGGDLVVQDSKVWLKTIAGLQQVDVILNRLEENQCDPLEMSSDAISGVPGLLEAIRSGNVCTANPIGSKVIENTGLVPFLPNLCRYFLDEDLILPSIASWWCGQKNEKDYVLDNLENLMVRPIFPTSDSKSWIPGISPEKDIKIWRQRIESRPHLFSGQEISGFAELPAFHSGQLQYKQVSLKTFITAKDESYSVMPGGFAYLKSDKQKDKQKNIISKDTFVLTIEPEKQVNLWLNPLSNQNLEPLFKVLSSREAENLFWAGRYVERLEGSARLMRIILSLIKENNEQANPELQETLKHLLPALSRVTLSFPGFVGKNSEVRLQDPRKELLALAADSDKAGGIQSQLLFFNSTANIIREFLPLQAWRIANYLKKSWKPNLSAEQIGTGKFIEKIDNLILYLSSFSGLISENMARESAWMLLNTGRRLERAINLIVLLKSTIKKYKDKNIENQVLESILKTTNSLIVFRRRYRSFMQPDKILELLLMDQNYPRALSYQLIKIQHYLQQLPVEQSSHNGKADELLVARTIADLQRNSYKVLDGSTEIEHDYLELNTLLNSQKDNLEKLSDILMQTYFSPSLNQQRFGTAFEEKIS